MTTEEQARNVAEYEAARKCDWWVSRNPRRGIHEGYRCQRRAVWLWLPKRDRALCQNHASGWLRQGETFEKIA